jgi:hypothetical protein
MMLYLLFIVKPHYVYSDVAMYNKYLQSGLAFCSPDAPRSLVSLLSSRSYACLHGVALDIVRQTECHRGNGHESFFSYGCLMSASKHGITLRFLLQRVVSKLIGDVYPHDLVRPNWAIQPWHTDVGVPACVLARRSRERCTRYMWVDFVLLAKCFVTITIQRTSHDDWCSYGISAHV